VFNSAMILGTILVLIGMALMDVRRTFQIVIPSRTVGWLGLADTIVLLFAE